MTAHSLNELHARRLREALERIATLRKEGERAATSGEFKQWKDRVNQSLVGLFGQGHDYQIRLLRLRFGTFQLNPRTGRSAWTQRQEEDLQNGLNGAETIISDALEEHKFREETDAAEGPPAAGEPPRSTLRLFISHSSRDVEFVNLLINLLRSSLNLPAEAIRCTSVNGYRLPAGADTKEQLKTEIHEAEAFIGIISPQSLTSAFVMFELGARWGARKHLIPLLSPGMTAAALAAPLSDLNALESEDPAQLHQLVRDLGAKLRITPSSAAAYHEALDAVCKLRQAPIAEESLPEEPSAEVGDLRIGALTEEMKRILLEAIKDPDPSVLMFRTMDGLQIQVNDTELTTGANRREVARLEAAVTGLERLGLLQDPTCKGEVFEFTSEGFDVADALTADRTGEQ